MNTINEFMNQVTWGIMNFAVFTVWALLVLSFSKWFIQKVTMALKSMFPTCKWFKSRKEREVK